VDTESERRPSGKNIRLLNLSHSQYSAILIKFLLLLFSLNTQSGCTAMALKRHSIAHAESAVDLRYREAMENLAMIAANPATLPAFTTIFSGSTNVTDTVPFGTNNVWTHPLHKLTTFASTLDFPMQRSVTQNWTLDPTIAPEKLRAMRCACWWVLYGPDNPFGDCSSLGKYHDGDQPGYYFDVAETLSNLPEGWVQHGACCDVPKDACYVASCRGKYVWVTPDSMEHLSSFVLVLQGIARVLDDSVYFPKISTRKVVLNMPKGFDDAKLGTTTNSVTVNIDHEGYVTPGSGVPSLPRKLHYDNVGTYSDLKSAISAAIKSP
jgi:hypothetical protein